MSGKIVMYCDRPCFLKILNRLKKALNLTRFNLKQPPHARTCPILFMHNAVLLPNPKVYRFWVTKCGPPRATVSFG